MMSFIDEETQVAIAMAMSQPIDDDLQTAINTSLRTVSDTKQRNTKKHNSTAQLCLARHTIAAAYDAEYIDDPNYPIIIFSDRSLFISAAFIVPPVTEAVIKKLRSYSDTARQYVIEELLGNAEANRCFFGAVMLSEYNLTCRLKYRNTPIQSPYQLSKICREQKIGASFIEVDAMVQTDDIPNFCRTFNVDVEIDDQYSPKLCSSIYNVSVDRPIIKISISAEHYTHALDKRYIPMV